MARSEVLVLGIFNRAPALRVLSPQTNGVPTLTVCGCCQSPGHRKQIWLKLHHRQNPNLICSVLALIARPKQNSREGLSGESHHQECPKGSQSWSESRVCTGESHSRDKGSRPAGQWHIRMAVGTHCSC